MSENNKKLSTDPYKGVRDFFPADMAIEKAIFGIWRENCEKYGYEEYGASVLEPADLYRAKSGAEIVNEQTYTFTDRGDREVTLRPEMTPTVARMIAARKRELQVPIRWFSIPNLFRYEQPQRGRTREHWQLNADIFGVASINAEIEMISLAYDITRSYGLKNTDFEVRLNNRKVMNYVTKEVFGLDEEAAYKISKLIDKKEKLKPEAFEMGVKEVFGAAVIPAPDRGRGQTPAGIQGDTDESRSGGNTLDSRSPKVATPVDGLRGNDNMSSVNDNVKQFLTLLNSKNFEEFAAQLPQNKEEHVGVKEIKQVIEGLDKLGITNVRFDQTLMRGFDYYTGIVFEIFDLNPANRRSVFGGGRYDDLLALFGNEKVPAVGFGAGDLIARDIMETYRTLPRNENIADLAICIVGEQNTPYALELAQALREKDLKIIVDLSNKKLGDQISNVSKRGIENVVCIGDEEVKNGKLRVKNLNSGAETMCTEEDIAKYLKSK
jgi:histidyl-tRNA synthetase